MTTDKVGFCSKCKIVRQDTREGIPVTDCMCTASQRHKPGCTYLLAVACPIDIGFHCRRHGVFACEECDCDCKGVKASLHSAAL